MTKRLALCLDGTWNTADNEQITNIVRIRDLIEPLVSTPSEIEEQRVYYHNGVGTGLSTRDRILGGATGLGLGRNVRSVYKFLSQNYEPGLEVYIFGFSRGAFTARSLTGYLGASGLLKPEHCTPDNEELAWRFYRTPPDDRFPSEHDALQKLCYDNVRIRLLGVFDTVGALGVPVEMFASWNRKRFQFHDVALGPNVDYALHALAIDEKRGPFQASLWQHPNHRYFKEAEQVWFPGVHANIGGGYENTGLSDRPLYWMLSRIENKKIGLKFISGWQNKVQPNAAGTRYDSRTRAYVWSRFSPMVRVINQRHLRLAGPARLSCLPRHAIPLNEMVDFSALWRWKKSEQSPGSLEPYRPVNLEAALDRTFSTENYHPIPIVNQDGEPLDWLRNAAHLQILESVLPDHYKRGCQAVARRFQTVSAATTDTGAA